MSLYLMINTRSSQSYTPHAIESFFRCTHFEKSDRFIVVDNDASLGGSLVQFKAVEVYVNPGPKSFAENANYGIDQASTHKHDLFLLNNDLIFTPAWDSGMRARADVITSPLCNQQIQYQTNNFLWANSLRLEDYLPRAQELISLSESHRRQNTGLQYVAGLAFFCVRIPYLIFSDIGKFDLCFGIGGAEDSDYCLRAIQAGYLIAYARENFVLHFSGKSTWSGAENSQQTTARVQTYSQAFERKWGKRLTELLLDSASGLNRELEARPELKSYVAERNWRGLMRQVMEN